MTIVKVSIVVPVYNVEKYLDRCIQSLINQTLKEIEIILVDDGSPDNCPKMCDEYAQKDNRIKVIHKRNAGLGYARNSGLEIATGEYVAFVDSDDYVDTTMYEILYKEASLYDLDYVSCSHYYVKNKPQPVNIQYNKDLYFSSPQDINNVIGDMVSTLPTCKIERLYSMSVWHGVYRNRIIQENHISFVSEREYLSEDIPFQVDFFQYCNKIKFLTKPLYFYCFNTNSLTHNFKIQKYDCLKNLYNLLYFKGSYINNIKLRVNRFLICYIKMLICNCVESYNISYKNKYKFIRQIINDNLWKDFKYPYKTLILSKRIFQYLINIRQSRLLYCYAKFYVYMKRLKLKY